MTNRTQLSRRTLLRGLGTAMALPALDAMSLRTGLAAGPTSADGHPLRMAFCFVPNGANLPKWTPRRTGFEYDLPFILEPLSSLRDEVNVLTGLTHDKGRSNGDGPGDHARSASVFLTGCQPRKTSGSNIHVGASVDQIAAQHIGQSTKFPSLELGTESGRNVGECDSGYSCAYSHNISWATPTLPMSLETNPRLVFDRLFSDDSPKSNGGKRREMLLRRSLLDFVTEDAKRIQGNLGRTDRRKLDEYLGAVREIERRIQRSQQDVASTSAPAGFSAPGGKPEDFGEHIRLLGDMIVLAFQTDSTRIASFMFGRAGSNLSYRQIGIPDGHHSLSHHGGNPVKLDKIARINRYHVEQFAYILNRLRSIPEGSGTLLDNCMIVYGSGLSDGNRHNNENLPILLAGRGGGSIVSGRHIVYQYETPMTNLYLSLLDRIDVHIESMGDSTGRLGLLS